MLQHFLSAPTIHYFADAAQRRYGGRAEVRDHTAWPLPVGVRCGLVWAGNGFSGKPLIQARRGLAQTQQLID